MRRISLPILFSVLASSLTAQQPLSAIEWLDTPSSTPTLQSPTTTLVEPPVTSSANTPGVDVTPLGEATPDSVGLLPTATTGLPRSIWKASASADLISALREIEPDTLPAVQALVYTLLLAEADSPLDVASDAAFLKARIHTLVRFGAVDPARALLERAGPGKRSLFDLWLNLTLLSGDEDKACAVLREDPGLTEDYAARIFCTARAGDWATAALTYDNAVAIGALDGKIAELLAQFLDPELIEGATSLAPPENPTPLVFRLYEAVGSPLPTRTLPRAFAMADLRGTTGWKSEIEAAERLTQTGALPATRLLGLYTDRRPAASGGVWDRVTAIQAFDNALFSRNPAEISQTLPAAWQAAKDEALAVPFAQLFADALMEIDLPETSREDAYHIALLSPEYERAALHFGGSDPTEHDVLASVALGSTKTDASTDAWTKGILEGLIATGPADRHTALLENGKLGEAILTAAIELGQVSYVDPRSASQALQTLRAVGLEDTARRAALQMMILGPPE